MKTLVLYVFHQYNERVDYFIKNATFEDANIHFLIICNDPILDFVTPDYVGVLKRPNHGYDFAAWSHALYHNDIYKNYDNFVFANSSIMGPYLPDGFTGRWTDIYTNPLMNNDIRLFGSTINCQFFLRKDIDIKLHPIAFSHIQSYIFSMNQQTLEYLMSCDIFSKYNHSDVFLQTIENKEVGMSRKIIENGWNIGCLMERYKDVDFRFIYKKPEDYNIEFLGDIMFPEYANKVFTPEELVFFKGNRCPNLPPPKKKIYNILI
jgi:hypothetical protein